MGDNRKIYGLGAEFSSAADLLAAAEKVRDAGFKKWDVHSPFPIHGMDAAMGLGKSWLSIPVFAGGSAGFITAILLTFIPSAFLYPLIVHGKPTNLMTVPAFFPIMFERAATLTTPPTTCCTISCRGFTCNRPCTSPSARRSHHAAGP